MGKNKKVSVTATAGSSGSKETNNLKTLQKEVAKSRKEIDKLRVELALLPDSISLIKNKNASVAGSSENKEIEKLKTLNKQLVAEVVESRKQIERLHFELASSADDQDIRADIQSDVFRLVLSSSLDEAAERSNVDMAAAMKKADSAAAELDTTEMRMHALVKEKDAIQMDMELILEERDSTLCSLEKAKKPTDLKHGRRFWKKWIYPVAIAAVAVASFCLAALVKFF